MAHGKLLSDLSYSKSWIVDNLLIHIGSLSLSLTKLSCGLTIVGFSYYASYTSLNSSPQLNEMFLDELAIVLQNSLSGLLLVSSS